MAETKRIVVNGKLLDHAMNGIPRYVCEVLKALDRIGSDRYRITVIMPEGHDWAWHPANLEMVKLPPCAGWDLRQAERYARECGALYVQMANRGAVYRNSVCVVHDVRPLTEKPGLSGKKWKNSLKYRMGFDLAIRNSREIVAVSCFTRDEILRLRPRFQKPVTIIGNGWEHLREIREDDRVFAEFPGLRKGKYILAVSSIAPHKNFRWIVENAKYNPELQYVIVGKTDTRLWSEDTGVFRDHVVYLDYRSDEQLISLYRNAGGLVFPSRYEGFGIPPLEAMSFGLKVWVSDIPVMHEIFGDTVRYIHPDRPEVRLQDLPEPAGRADQVLEKYRWAAAGQAWHDLFCRL